MSKDKITIPNIKKHCGHWTSEQVSSLGDGLCPICLKAEVEEKDKDISDIRSLSLSGTGPHRFDPSNCPTFYDRCNCTVATLIHNIERAEKTEAALIAANKRVTELEEANKWLLYNAELEDK